MFKIIFGINYVKGKNKYLQTENFTNVEKKLKKFTLHWSNIKQNWLSSQISQTISCETGEHKQLFPMQVGSSNAAALSASYSFDTQVVYN